MLGEGEHRHIHSDFREDADGGKGLDTWRRHNKIELVHMSPFTVLRTCYLRKQAGTERSWKDERLK